MIKFSLFICILIGILYHYAPKCSFTFDDWSAVVENNDVKSDSSFINLIWNDFWGTPIAQERSHKSYRPFTTLTFKLNNILFGMNPMYYHLINIFLYAINCLLFYKFCYKLITSLFPKPSTNQLSIAHIATILFTVHPIHVESVMSVVGRAELLSGIFYLLAILSTFKMTFLSKILSFFFVICSVLSKEQGITSIVVCLFIEIMIIRKINLFRFLKVFSIKNFFNFTLIPLIIFGGFHLMLILVILLWRLYVMKGTLPHFTKFDNPASHASSPSRQLTYNYLLPLNLWMLISPSDLLCDWSMGVIDLITGFSDPRNISTLLFWTLIILLFRFCITNKATGFNGLISVSLLILISSFLPASNLFFPVGFVVAERVLFLPSMGYCLLIATLFIKIFQKNDLKTRKLIGCFFLILISSHALKTMIRSRDWKDDNSLFISALKVTQKNAKVWNNIGHSFEKEGADKIALSYYLQAARVQPDDEGSFINIASACERLHLDQLAEDHYLKAKALLPQPIKGRSYEARVAPKHLQIFISLGNLLKKNQRFYEADLLYQEAISLRSSFVDAYLNRGEVLSLMGKHHEAIINYKKALNQTSASKSDLFFNIGIMYNRMKKYLEAYEAYTWAIHHDKDNIKALVNSASILIDTLNEEHLKVAESRLSRVLKIDSTNIEAQNMIGLVYIVTKRETLAFETWRNLLKMKPNHEATLYNLAFYTYKSGKDWNDCASSLKRLIQVNGSHKKALLMYGDILFNKLKDFQTAKTIFKKLLFMSKDVDLEVNNNLCLSMLHLEELEESERCFSDLNLKLPGVRTISENLQLVRRRLEEKNSKKINDLESKEPKEEETFSDEDDIFIMGSSSEDDYDLKEKECVTFSSEADRIRKSLLDLVQDSNPKLIDLKLERASKAIKDLTDLKRSLTDLDDEQSLKEEQDSGREELLRVLDKLESQLF